MQYGDLIRTARKCYRQCPGRVLELAQVLINWVPRAISKAIKWQGREVILSPKIGKRS
jgi:hypothetical protein